MAIYHQTQVVPVTAGANLTECEGCFVKLSSGKAVLTAASDTAATIYGLVHSGDAADKTVDIILPGHSGIVGMMLHSSATNVANGTGLALAANGTVKNAGSNDTVVAVALAAGTAGELVAARFAI